jgi:hypothetical protein
MPCSIARLLGWLLGLGLLGNSLIMLAVPALWYAHMPGVVDTGPFNAHFVREIGTAYLVCGVALVWFAMRQAARPAAPIGAAFLAVHALMHLFDAATGREAVEQLSSMSPQFFCHRLWRSGSHGCPLPEASS